MTEGVLSDLVRQGKVLYIGVSEWRAEEIAAALKIADQMGLDRIVSNQPQYNMIWRVIESEVIPLSLSEGIGQIVWSPIAQGVLTGKYLPGAAPPAGSRATDERGSGFVTRYLTEEILAKVQLLKPVAEQAGLTLAQLDDLGLDDPPDHVVLRLVRDDPVQAQLIGDLERRGYFFGAPL